MGYIRLLLAVILTCQAFVIPTNARNFLGNQIRALIKEGEDLVKNEILFDDDRKVKRRPSEITKPKSRQNPGVIDKNLLSKKLKASPKSLQKQGIIPPSVILGLHGIGPFGQRRQNPFRPLQDTFPFDISENQLMPISQTENFPFQISPGRNEISTFLSSGNPLLDIFQFLDMIGRPNQGQGHVFMFQGQIQGGKESDKIGRKTNNRQLGRKDEGRITDHDIRNLESNGKILSLDIDEKGAGSLETGTTDLDSKITDDQREQQNQNQEKEHKEDETEGGEEGPIENQKIKHKQTNPITPQKTIFGEAEKSNVQASSVVKNIETDIHEEIKTTDINGAKKTSRSQKIKSIEKKNDVPVRVTGGYPHKGVSEIQDDAELHNGIFFNENKLSKAKVNTDIADSPAVQGDGNIVKLKIDAKRKKRSARPDSINNLKVTTRKKLVKKRNVGRHRKVDMSENKDIALKETIPFSKDERSLSPQGQHSDLLNKGVITDEGLNGKDKQKPSINDAQSEGKHASHHANDKEGEKKFDHLSSEEDDHSKHGHSNHSHKAEAKPKSSGNTNHKAVHTLNPMKVLILIMVFVALVAFLIFITTRAESAESKRSSSSTALYSEKDDHTYYNMAM